MLARVSPASHVIRCLRRYLPSWPYMVNLARQPGANTHMHTYAHMHTHTTRVPRTTSTSRDCVGSPPARVPLRDFSLGVPLPFTRQWFPLTLNPRRPYTVLVTGLWYVYKH